MWQIISTFVYQHICAIILMTGVYYFARFVLGEKTKITRQKFFITLQIVYIIQTIIYLTLAGTLKTIFMLIINALYIISLPTVKGYWNLF